jgi:hypothetical protein
MKPTNTEKDALVMLMRLARETSRVEDDIVKAMGGDSLGNSRISGSVEDALNYILTISGVRQYMIWAEEIESNIDGTQDVIGNYMYGFDTDKAPEQILDDLFKTGEELSKEDHDTFLKNLQKEM